MVHGLLCDHHNMENHSLQDNHMLFMHYGVNESTYIFNAS